MSKVTEQLDFMWEKRVKDLYDSMRLEQDIEGMELIVAILKLQGLTVKGIEG